MRGPEDSWCLLVLGCLRLYPFQRALLIVWFPGWQRQTEGYACRHVRTYLSTRHADSDGYGRKCTGVVMFAPAPEAIKIHLALGEGTCRHGVPDTKNNTKTERAKS